MKCKCGCDAEATYIVKSFEYDPRAPQGKGREFAEHCCRTSADYLSECAAELGLQYDKIRISKADDSV